MYSIGDNIKIIIGKKEDRIIEKHFKSRVSRYHEGLTENERQCFCL